MWSKTFHPKLENVDIKLLKLTQPKELTNLKTDPWLSIADLYRKPDYYSHLTATVLNAIFTSSKHEILLSRRILEQMIQADDNIERNTINSKEFAVFMAKLCKVGTIVKVSDWSFDKVKNKGKAAVYHLKDDYLLALLKPSEPAA
jgi:hypothetical protein